MIYARPAPTEPIDQGPSEGCAMTRSDRSKLELGDRAVAIYHCVYAHERFEESAQTLFKLVRDAQERAPGQKRLLYLDIEGHRNSEGGFDADMLELQKEFLIGFFGHFLNVIIAPLVNGDNAKPQDNDIPPQLLIEDQRDGAD
jgi:hypothetical protein